MGHESHLSGSHAAARSEAESETCPPVSLIGRGTPKSRSHTTVDPLLLQRSTAAESAIATGRHIRLSAARRARRRHRLLSIPATPRLSSRIINARRLSSVSPSHGARRVFHALAGIMPMPNARPPRLSPARERRQFRGEVVSVSRRRRPACLHPTSSMGIPGSRSVTGAGAVPDAGPPQAHQRHGDRQGEPSLRRMHRRADVAFAAQRSGEIAGAPEAMVPARRRGPDRATDRVRGQGQHRPARNDGNAGRPRAQESARARPCRGLLLAHDAHRQALFRSRAVEAQLVAVVGRRLDCAGRTQGHRQIHLVRASQRRGWARTSMSRPFIRQAAGDMAFLRSAAAASGDAQGAAARAPARI